MGFSHIIHRNSFVLNWCFVLAVSKTEKHSLEHLSKHSLDKTRCWYVCDFLSLPKCSSILVVKCLQAWPTYYLYISHKQTCNPINGSLESENKIKNFRLTIIGLYCKLTQKKVYPLCKRFSKSLKVKLAFDIH